MSVSSLSWPEVNMSYRQDYPRILRLIDLVMTLPASSSENKRGFSHMKLVKTDRRTRMKTSILDCLMTIQLCSPCVSTFNPDPAIEKWTCAGKRRPAFMDTRTPKRRRLPIETEEVEMDLQQEMDEQQVMEKQLEEPLEEQGAVSIRKTVFPGMAITMLKIRRLSGRLIFNMEIAKRRKDGLYIETGPWSLKN